MVLVHLYTYSVVLTWNATLTDLGMVAEVSTCMTTLAVWRMRSVSSMVLVPYTLLSPWHPTSTTGMSGWCLLTRGSH